MSKPTDPKPEERQGDIELKVIKNNQFDGLYKPRKKMAEVAGLKLGISAKMVHVNLSKQTLTIYPLVTWPDHTDFLKSKYKKIERICFPIEESLCDFFRKKSPFEADDLLMLLRDVLLPGFTQDPDYGLGIAREFKDVIDAIEEHSDCIEIRFSETDETSIGDKTKVFTLNIDDYEEAKRKKLEILLVSDRKLQPRLRTVQFTIF